MKHSSLLGRFALRNAAAIGFICLGLCAAGIYAALHTPSSVFPQTDFPRVVILVDNGVMPTDDMMAVVTRPIEEAMKDIPGSVTIRSSTGRGAAEINVFFDWRTDMPQAELYVLGRLAQIRGTLPATINTNVFRLTFASFPVIGISLTSPSRSITQLWETARYDLKPRFLRIPGVARVNLVGGRAPEYHVVVDPLRLQAMNLTLAQVVDALNRSNIIASTGMHEENHTLYLTVLDNRVHGPQDIENLTLGAGGHPVNIREFAQVLRAPEPVFNRVTAEGVDAVLLNVYSQPDGSTLGIAARLDEELRQLRQTLPPDMKLAYFYDQSLLVGDSVKSVWEAIGFGLLLSTGIIFAFLKNWGTTFTATAVIPVTVLATLLAMKLAGLSFNLMTLGGITAAIGLVIDDAIVVVEAIHAKQNSHPVPNTVELSTGKSPPRQGMPGSMAMDGAQQRPVTSLSLDSGNPCRNDDFEAALDSTTVRPGPLPSRLSRQEAVELALGEIFRPLLGSTLTPVVVFLPLTLLDGIPGVFFRALALTMVVALLASLVLALTLTPSLAAGLMRSHSADAHEQEGALFGRVAGIYETALRLALRRRGRTLLACGLVLAIGGALYSRLDSDFLPAMDEGGFVIDYIAPWGASLSEANRQLLQAEDILRAVPEVESYSRRTGARLALAITEPNTGDFLVKLKTGRRRNTEAVIGELREKFNAALPGIQWEFPGILGDLIGDLAWSPKPVELKLFSTDVAFLQRKAREIEAAIKQIPGVVDTFDGLAMTGPSIRVRVRNVDAQRYGFMAGDVAAALHSAMLGQKASYVLEGDRVVNIRVRLADAGLARMEDLRNLPLRAADGSTVKLSQIADLLEEPSQLELHREDLRQNVAVSAHLEGRDLGSAMGEIRSLLSRDQTLPPGTLELGGLYRQQQEAFRNLLGVLAMALVLVLAVLLMEFRSFLEPLAILFGAVLALSGTVLALIITGTSLNIVSILGAIIGIGIVAKNGILLLDYVGELEGCGLSLEERLIQSGRRRLRPVLMTSLAAALGLLPLAVGLGSGADMLKPLAIAVIGALCFSVLLSLIATPTVYLVLRNRIEPPVGR